ncbi:diaminopimelate decarboxylase family protein [Arenibaculum sp.]|uniref:diaminopimelate decarboxylase family protein n=1 Tax=Arenibaculum sp. TaxID=2865862 RepID=UPI002E104E1B|nr:alanine racemase [Arenibaculum sp.]
MSIPSATAEEAGTIPSATYAAVAERFGTPTHVLDLARIERNYRNLRGAFDAAGLRMDVLYSVKTNYMPIVLGQLKALGAGMDVVSGFELDLALRLGFDGAAIVFNGPHKTDAEIERAMEAGVTINLDAPAEAMRVNAVARRLGRRVPVGLRVNPGIGIYLSADPSYNAQAAQAARESKFGLSLADGAAAAAAELIASCEHLSLVGLHCHVGSQITDEAALASAIDAVLAFGASLRPRHPIAVVNIGGGFGVPGIRRTRRGLLGQMLALHGSDALDGQKDGFDLALFARALRDAVGRHGLEDIRLCCEPGRAIVSDAMTLLSRVSSVKRSGGLDWVIVDAGLNLMPTIAMNEEHAIRSLVPDGGAMKPFRVAGPMCYEADILGASRMLPEATAEGDLVLIEDSGAYTVSRSTNFIRPRAPVVAIGNGGMELCWRREEFDDIFAFHTPTSFFPEALHGR